MTFRDDFIARAEAEGYTITAQRLAVVDEVARADDHPTVDELHARVLKGPDRLSKASVYRTIDLLDRLGLLIKHDFGDGKVRVEPMTKEKHDHLIDVESGQIVEFSISAIEAMQREVADQLGYELVDYKLEIYARPQNAKSFVIEDGEERRVYPAKRSPRRRRTFARRSLILTK